MKYLVTGGTGYVGQHVVHALARRNHHVLVASRKAPVERLDNVEHIECDVLNEDGDIFKHLQSPDILVHLAWEDGFNHSSSKHLDNLPKHVNFLRNMLTSGLKHIVGVGTMHEIGFHIGPVKEDTPTFPQHAYGIAKNHLRLVQSLLCREYHAIDHWIRCYYIVGDDHLNNSIFSKILNAEEMHRETFPLNTGELLYDFISVSKLGEMIADVSEQREIAGIINCCSGDPVSLKTMVLRFIEERGLKIRPVWGEFPLRQYDSRAIWGDLSKLNQVREVLGREKILR